jgi:Ser/Thr protein kinase RdoA (MazF antagonist)
MGFLYNTNVENIFLLEIEEQFAQFYGLKGAKFQYLNTLVNDIFAVTTAGGKFALKLYHTPYRTLDEVQWELDLLLHLVERDAPIAKPVIGKNGYIQTFSVNGVDRIALLFEWAPGKKPKPSTSTYINLGRAAAQIHQAADTFTSALNREQYDLHLLIDEQLQRMEHQLKAAKQWEKVSQLSERLKKLVKGQILDYGVCHMDLTLDNIHIKENLITVFDFDSAGKSWRAIEPYGVLKSSKEYFNAWLEGYRPIRPFNKANEYAVSAFVIIGEIRNVTWKLGLANSSRGKPLITSEDLPEIVEEWLTWEEQSILHH